MSAWGKQEISNAITAVQEKAARDEEFRELCKRDIHAAIREATGKEVPQAIRIQVVDQTGYHLSVVLPAQEKAGGELDEQELEQVAGGSKDFWNSDFQHPNHP